MDGDTYTQPDPRQSSLLVWACAAAGAVLFWAALPPLELAPLAWLAPIPWVLLIRLPELPGRRPYLALYAVGVAFWLAAVYWLTLPHWSTGFGWVALSLYLGMYLPLFVYLSRVLVQQLNVPVLVAAPMVWVGFELVRAYVFTGFLMAALGHTQYRWLPLIQISDLVGAYGVSFLIVLVAAAMGRAIPLRGDRVAVLPLVIAGCAFAAALVYGHFRLNEILPDAAQQPVRIALVQGTIDTEFGVDMRAVKKRTYEQYLSLSLDAIAADPRIELVVWPESMYRAPLVVFDDDTPPPDSLHSDEPQFTRELLAETARTLDRPLIAATDGLHWDRNGLRQYCSSVYVPYDARDKSAGTTLGPTIGPVQRYDKMHLVPFGEYIPFGDWFPALYRLSESTGTLSGGLRPGEGPKSYGVGPRGELRLAPSICFESCVPHFIRRQVNELTASGERPDVLLTQTNDGWFWGSTALDMHLVCGVFRAIETRRPFLTAANTGISAWIDGNGRIIRRAAKRKPEVIVADVTPDGRESFYLRGGDWFAGACLGACLAAAVYAVGNSGRGLFRLPNKRGLAPSDV